MVSRGKVRGAIFILVGRRRRTMMVTTDVMKEGGNEAAGEGGDAGGEAGGAGAKEQSKQWQCNAPACGIVLTRSKRPRESATMLSNLFPILICMKRILLVLSVINM